VRFIVQKKARGMRPPHRDDVLSIDVYPPRYAASGCADGSIMIWSLETLHPLFKVRSRLCVTSEDAAADGSYQSDII